MSSTSLSGYVDLNAFAKDSLELIGKLNSGSEEEKQGSRLIIDVRGIVRRNLPTMLSELTNNPKKVFKIKVLGTKDVLEKTQPSSCKRHKPNDYPPGGMVWSYLDNGEPFKVWERGCTQRVMERKHSPNNSAALDKLHTIYHDSKEELLQILRERYGNVGLFAKKVTTQYPKYKPSLEKHTYYNHQDEASEGNRFCRVLEGVYEKTTITLYLDPLNPGVEDTCCLAKDYDGGKGKNDYIKLTSEPLSKKLLGPNDKIRPMPNCNPVPYRP